MTSEDHIDTTPSSAAARVREESDISTLEPGTPVVRKVRFYMNTFHMEKEWSDLPSTITEFVELAELVPNGSKLAGKIRIVSFLAESGGPPEVSVLHDRDDIRAFWRKVSAGPNKQASVTVTSESVSSFSRWWRPKYAPLALLALAAAWNPTLMSLLPADMKPVAMVGREAVAFFGQQDSRDRPKDQMTNFALANVQTGESPSSQFLEGTLMQNARTYSKSVLFETTSADKHHAVVNALANTNLDPNVSQKIGLLVGNTTMLVDQFSDFIYDSDGKATTFTVNVWVTPKKTSGEVVQVALMVSGASFKKAIVKAIEEVEVPQFRETRIYHEATFWRAAYVEHIKDPITVDGTTQLVRKVGRAVFDHTSIKANEMEILRSYLMTLASHDTLRNYAPEKMPLTVFKRLATKMPSPSEPEGTPEQKV